MLKNLINSLYSFEGRLARLDYLGLGLGSAFLHVIVGCLLTAGAYYISDILAGIVIGVFCMAYIVSALSIAVRRFHDLNLSGGMYALCILGVIAIAFIVGFNDPAGIDSNPIPDVLNLILGGIMLFTPGTKGTNDYGVDPLAEWRQAKAAKWLAKAQRKAGVVA